MRSDLFVNVLPAIPVLLAHLAGVIVGGVLLIRADERRTAGVLALLGFGSLLVLDVASFARGPLITTLSRRTLLGIRLAVAGVGCCYSILETAATLCLVVAVGQAMGRTTQLDELKTRED